MKGNAVLSQDVAIWLEGFYKEFHLVPALTSEPFYILLATKPADTWDKPLFGHFGGLMG